MSAPPADRHAPPSRCLGASEARDPVRHTVDTPAGVLTLSVYDQAPTPFYACTRLDGVPIHPADARPLLKQIGHELAGMRYLAESWPG